MRLRIPAKVNLHLQVLGRRPDGFHELRTLYQSIDCFDVLDLEPAENAHLQLTVSPEGAVPADADNLVIKAARSLWKEAGDCPGARIQLLKRIPVGAGLGGGSADAAAALCGLRELWALDVNDAALNRIAVGLGSDVPFFLSGGSALGVGRGEEVYPLEDLPQLEAVVAHPRIHVATAEVFSRLPRQLTWARLEDSVYAFVTGAGKLRWDRLVNDLQPMVCETWPEVDELLTRMSGHEPLRAAVTGSGSAVFGIFQAATAADRAAEDLREIAWVHRGVTLPRERSRPQRSGRHAN